MLPPPYPLYMGLGVALLVAACAAPPAPRPGAKPPPQSRIEVQRPPAPRWRPAPVEADGRAVSGGREHVVRSGHTGLAIARAYGVPWRRIAEANRIDPESILRVGQRLFVPTEAQARAAAQPGRAPPTPEELAAGFRLDIDDLVTGAGEASAAAAPPPARQPASPPAATSPAPSAAQVPPLGWPVDGRVILSTFGPKAGGRVNDGVNIRALRGSPVRAAADGQVVYVGDAIAGLGNLVILRHAQGVSTVYGHLEEPLVARGERVSRGAPIGRAGNSGSAKEPQLLFQLRLGQRAVDPLPFLRRG
ncbi:MAG: peptidoglycan DD-metalloendopeptidase family protein [Thermaurantiacus sp.]